MSTVDAEWLGDLQSADAALLEWALGGALSEAGRQAAIEASLSLLGVYFSGGEQELVDRSAIGTADVDQELDALQAGLRFRVAIAAGRRLARLLDAIVKRPTFRYQLRGAQHVGSLNGALDINRWVTQPKGDQDLSFPVLEVQRGLDTPENVLAIYAVRWLLQELRVSFAASLATTAAVEYQAVRHLRDRLTRAIQLPALAGCARAAAAVRTHTAAQHLVNDVKRRLRRREIANARPYGDLANWIDGCLAGQLAVAAGEIDLALYGDRFDNKLFELWCLGFLGRALSEALHLPEATIQPGWRRSTPAYIFDAFSGRIELYFQRGLRAVDELHAGRWAKDNGRRLGGIPDIVVSARPTIGDRRYAVIDPKLRQRDRLPAEELYKILGYLQNFEVSPAVGIVLIYTTNNDLTPADVFHDGQGGTLISASLNPVAPPDVMARSIEEVIRTVLGLIDHALPDDGSTRSNEAQGTTDEQRDELALATIRSSVEAWGRAHLSEIGPSRQRIETLVGDVRWKALNDDVQVMMATADLVGNQLDSTADFSGPVIGMCAAVEHVIHAFAIAPIVGDQPGYDRQTRTFGAALDSIDLASKSRGGQLSGAIRRQLTSAGVKLDTVIELMPLWRRLNSKYRIPAAHRQVLTKADWQQVYRLVMGPDALFTRTFDALQTST